MPPGSSKSTVGHGLGRERRDAPSAVGMHDVGQVALRAQRE
jgi:hypothetical protein